MDVSDLTIGIASLSATALGQIATFTEWWFAMPDPSLDLQESNEPTIEHLRAAVAELIAADLDMHPVYGNTAACSGGVGGAMVTAHCAELCQSPKHDAARERHEMAVRRLSRWVQGAPLDA